jgi:hypothetical protein
MSLIGKHRRRFGGAIAPILTGDTYVRDGANSATNYDGGGLVLKHESVVGFQREIVLSFDNVKKSACKLRIVSSSDAVPSVTTTFDVQTLPESTDETSATYESVNARPWVTIATGLTVVCDAVGAVKEFSLAGLQNSNGISSLRLKPTSNTSQSGARSFYSKETAPSANESPQLI